MSFNGPSYGAAKKLTESIASGFDHAVRTGDNTFSIFFVNGSKIDLTIPLPKDGTDGKDGEKGDTGLSITGATFNSSGKLVIELSDGSFLAPVTMPSASVDVSQAEGNCLEQKADGMFVAKTDISNLVEKETGKGLSSNDYTDEDKKNISDNKDAIDKLNGDDSTVGSVAYQIADALGKLNKLSKKIVDVLPSADEADANTIYMVKEDGGNYAMYTVVTLADGSKSLASMGSTDIDLTDYVKTEDAKITYLALADVKKDVLTLLDSTTENDIVYLTYNGSKILTKSQIETLFEDYTTKQYVDDEVDKKVDKTAITKTLDVTKTDEQVPSAKAVFDELENKIGKDYGTSHKGEVLVIGEDGKVTAKAFDVIDDSATESTTTTLSAKKINDSLVDKADADKVVNFEYIRDTSSADAKALIEKHWSEHENFKCYNLHLDTSKWAWSAEIYFHTSEYGTVILRSYGNDASNIWYGKVYAGVWTWQELATMDKVQTKANTMIQKTYYHKYGSEPLYIENGHTANVLIMGTQNGNQFMILGTWYSSVNKFLNIAGTCDYTITDNTSNGFTISMENGEYYAVIFKYL